MSLAAPVVFAHGLVGRADLPIPAELFGAAAAVVLALSFAGLAAGWTSPRLEEPRERRLVRLPLAVDVVLGGLGVAVFAVAVWAGLTGTDVATDNLLPTLVYVAFWVGIPVASLLVGNVFALLSPWRAVGRVAGTLVRRFGGEDVAEPVPYPQRLGMWPAAVTLALFAAVELTWGRGDDPQVIAVLAIAYFVLQLAGMGIFGVDAWTRNGDGFAVYFRLFASLAPLARGADGALVARRPLAGAARLARPAGFVAVLAVAIGATMFDGAKEGSLFGSVVPDLQDAFTGLGLSKGAALEWTFVVGLAACILFVAGLYAAGIGGMPRREGAARRLAHSLIPIAAAYVIAHYFSLLAYQGQALWPLASDPGGTGADWFGGAGAGIDYGVVSATAIWYVQVAALVCGHVAGLVLAHDRALVLYGSAKAATRSQAVMLVMMIAFTSVGLWLLSVANE